MKKHGFTLAELLVTLGIIGVVSALVIPTFITNASEKTVGPKLLKAYNTFQNASAAMVDDLDVNNDLAMASGVITSQNTFFTNLGHYMRGSYSSSEGQFTGNDGVTYWLTTNTFDTSVAQFPHEVDLLTVGSSSKAALLGIDINGVSEPNGVGKDRFYFHLMHDGSLRPYGGTYDSPRIWTKVCPDGATPTDSMDMAACTAHIINNNGKVGYNLSGMKTKSLGDALPVTPVY